MSQENDGRFLNKNKMPLDHLSSVQETVNEESSHFVSVQSQPVIDDSNV